GAPSTHHTWSPSSAPAPSSTKANSSNAPSTSHPNRRRQSLKPSDRRAPETHRSTGLDNISSSLASCICGFIAAQHLQRWNRYEDHVGKPKTRGCQSLSCITQFMLKP